VDVRDVALAHVEAASRGDAGNTRVLLIGAVAAWRDVLSMARRALSVSMSGEGGASGAKEGVMVKVEVEDGPMEVLAAIPTEMEEGGADGNVPYPQAIASIRSAYRLGVSFTPLEDTIADSTLSLVAGGHVGLMGTLQAVGAP